MESFSVTKIVYKCGVTILKKTGNGKLRKLSVYLFDNILHKKDSATKSYAVKTKKEATTTFSLYCTALPPLSDA